MFWLVYSLYSLWGFVFKFSEIYPTNLALNNGSLFRKTYFANCNSFFATGFNNCCLLAKFSSKANASLLTEPISHWQFSKLIIACTEYLLIIFHLRKELLKWRHAALQILFFWECQTPDWEDSPYLKSVKKAVLRIDPKLTICPLFCICICLS